MISIRDLHEGSRRQTVRAIRAERKLSLYPSPPPSLPSCHKQWAAAPSMSPSFSKLLVPLQEHGGWGVRQTFLLSISHWKYEYVKLYADRPSQASRTKLGIRLVKMVAWGRTHTAVCAVLQPFAVMSQAWGQTVIKGLAGISVWMWVGEVVSMRSEGIRFLSSSSAS